MREKIRSRQYVMTLHAEEEMDEDELSIFDIESIILSGSIIERQRDSETAEWKYIVEGETIEGSSASAVGKISATLKLVIITVYRE